MSRSNLVSDSVYVQAFPGRCIRARWRKAQPRFAFQICCFAALLWHWRGVQEYNVWVNMGSV